MDNLHYDDFLPHLHTRFWLIADNGARYELELQQLTENSPSPRQEQFVLLFRAPATAPPHQGIYGLQHEQLGQGELFMVPISRDAAGLYYEVTFNRPQEEPKA
jgi:hypothetical protein